MRRYQSLRALGSLLVMTCLWGALATAQAAARLTEAAARVRSLQVKDLSYSLELDLEAQRSSFGGWVRSRFQFQPQGQELRVDFAKGKVVEVLVNDKVVSFRSDPEALYLSESLFQAGASNSLAIHFEHTYSKDGNGLYRYQDSSDGEVYVYTHFEPYAANQMFPCFDQPDLKARFRVTVKAPRHWTVVSSLRESRVQESGSQRLWTFPETLPFSTYLFALHAGPYQVWEDKNFRYPLRVMARKSLAARVPSAEWFDITRRGFDFYERYLGTPYPFGKYDQVAVPDFNAGAMENVAAVTFSERFLVSGYRTQSLKESLAGTILHEMAHMWFGDLVTMKWWNDLWLNESFATYASTLAMASFPEFPEEWLSFARGKARAYRADASVTTHPIVAQVPDTETAESNFDGITYTKGASFLHLLHFIVGESAFQKGLQLYFQKHSFSNAEVGDLIAALETSSQRSLQDFTKSWLQTAGPNTVSVRFECKDDKLTDLRILQTAEPRTPELREHKAVFGFYRNDAARGPQLYHRQDLAYQGAETRWAGAHSLACPELIVPNLESYDYVKVRFDPASRRFAMRELHRIPDAGVRIQIWNSLALSVEEGELSIDDYVAFFETQFAKEKNYEVLRAIESVQERSFFAFIDGLSEQQRRSQLLQSVTQQYEAFFQDKTRERDAKLLFFSDYVTALTKAGRSAELFALHQGVRSFPDLTIEQEQRWELLQALSDLRYKGLAKLVTAERKLDKSSLAQRHVLAADASAAPYKEKMAMLKPIVQGTSKLSAADRISILDHLFPETQEDERRAYETQLSREVDGAVRRLEPRVAGAYVLGLLSLDCRHPPTPLLPELLAKSYPEGLHKALLSAEESLQRCRRIVSQRPLGGS